MNTNFKPLGLAAAVAAVAAGYAGSTQAQGLSNNGLGDMAIIPYYTVQGDFVTGFHIINTSAATQVVKLRFRRASDSMDALDFNIVLSPKDEWTGFIDDSSGTITVGTDDASCTAPLEPYYSAGQYPMPPLYAAGAEEGYVEVIGMGEVQESKTTTDDTGVSSTTNPLNGAAKHDSTGVPADCASAETNFFRYAGGSTKGVVNSETTHQLVGTDTTATPNAYLDTPNVLKVSYFVRDGGTGLEFGGEAVHFADFSTDAQAITALGGTTGAMMTNQEQIDLGAVSPDPYSFLFPDLDGGSPADRLRGLYDTVIRDATTGIGGRTVINDWSVAAARNVSTDWVVTMPGQYLMLDLAKYTAKGATGAGCLSAAAIAAQLTPSVPPDVTCDARDIPVVLNSAGSLGEGVWDREEQTFSTPSGGLVISPSVGIGPAATTLENEVNVIEWTAGENPPVLDSAYTRQFDVSALGADFGWAQLSVTSDPKKAITDATNGLVSSGHGVYNFALSAPVAPGTPGLGEPTFVEVANPVPIAGFVVWERSFPSDPSANYGRLVDHSYGS